MLKLEVGGRDEGVLPRTRVLSLEEQDAMIRVCRCRTLNAIKLVKTCETTVVLIRGMLLYVYHKKG